jgi:hypothetical protein
VWFDGTYVHYAYVNPQERTYIYYRRGTPNSDGTITWSADEQLATAAGTYYWPMIAVDSNGRPIIGFKDGGDYPWVTKSARNDGTWETASGFPYQLSTTAMDNWRVIITPLTGGKFYAIYTTWYTPGTRGRLWDGGFGGEEQCAPSRPQINDGVSATSDGDDVYLAFQTAWPEMEMAMAKRTYGVGWGGEEHFDPVVGSSTYTAITVIRNVGVVYFWVYAPASGETRIYYKKRVGGTWDETPNVWLDESYKKLEGFNFTSSYSKMSGQVLLAWLRDATGELMYGFDPIVGPTRLPRQPDPRLFPQGIPGRWHPLRPKMTIPPQGWKKS